MPIFPNRLSTFPFKVVVDYKHKLIRAVEERQMFLLAAINFLNDSVKIIQVRNPKQKGNQEKALQRRTVHS